ncbi:MAG: VTT domain-containing protein [Neomegalonema sp.]|nr:VTT domain-containing protein [Neomegalonema sp.]
MQARSTKSGRPLWRRLLLPGALLLLFASAFYFLGDVLSFATLQANHERLTEWRDANFALALAVFALAYAVIVALSIPGAVWMTIGSGFLFGTFLGTSISVLAATIGASLIFLAARTALGNALKEQAGPWLARIEAGVRENEASYLLLLRLVPAVPFFIANLAPAFVGVSFRTYLWTTFLGIIPATAVFASVGAGLGEVLERGEQPDLGILFEPHVIGPILGLAALSALPILIKALRGKKTSAPEGEA